MTTRRKNNRPISAIKSELITLLEFTRVSVKKFPKTTDKVLTHMDLSDEAFMDEINVLADAVNFDFDDPNDEDDELS